MQTLAFILYCLLLMALVIGGLIHDAPVGEQPEPSPHLKPSHALGRQIERGVRRRMKERN